MKLVAAIAASLSALCSNAFAADLPTGLPLSTLSTEIAQPIPSDAMPKDNVIQSAVGTIRPELAAHLELYSGPMCLRVKWKSQNYHLYSESYSEAWVTGDECSKTQGPRVNVDKLFIDMKYRDGTRVGSSCQNSAMCAKSERHYGAGKSIECAKGTLTHEGESISSTTDIIGCPR